MGTDFGVVAFRKTHDEIVKLALLSDALYIVVADLGAGTPTETDVERDRTWEEIRFLLLCAVSAETVAGGPRGKFECFLAYSGTSEAIQAYVTGYDLQLGPDELDGFGLLRCVCLGHPSRPLQMLGRRNVLSDGWY
jgi:hypothetical protein